MYKVFKTAGILLLINLMACTVNKAKLDNSLETHFAKRNVTGSFAFLNNKDGKITVYNLGGDTTRYLPASTFKIVNSLIGLQTGVILNDTMKIAWDGVVRQVPEWNKAMGFSEAFKVSAVPYFQEVARRIGKDTMKLWLDSLGYGNLKMSERIDSFWLDNSLKISPDEQLGLVKKLYFDQLPFRKSVQHAVRMAMLQENNTAYKLSYKTGWGHNEENHSIGWVVGWIEENNHPYFFSLLVESPDKNADMPGIRMGILKDILNQYGFFKGNK